MMKNTIIILVLVFLLVAGWTFFPQIVQADVEWKIIKDLDLKTTPLDVAPSADGKWLFILTPGEILHLFRSRGDDHRPNSRRQGL